MKGEICSLVFAVVFVPAVILGWLNVADALRTRRVRRAFLNMPADLRRQILNCIDRHGRDNPACAVLVATEVDPPVSSGDVVGSHFGGLPYAEVGDFWPALQSGDARPADFLIQVRLDDSLPSPWPGRLIVVFNRDDPAPTVRCYSSPAPERAIALTGGPASLHPWTLHPVRIPGLPAEDATAGPGRRFRGLLNYDPVVLLETVPELAELIPHSTRPSELLAMVLAPNQEGSYGFELSDIVQVAGEPVWLGDDPGGISCGQCGRPMRFLFQFGDLNGGPSLGESGVCYLFGCDEHPNQVHGIVQNC